MEIQRPTTEQILGTVGLVALTVGTFVVLQPFLNALLFALILTIASWPAFEQLEHRLNERNTLAAAIATGALVAVLLIPVTGLAIVLADDVAQFVGEFRSTVESPPEPPAWLVQLPIVGDRLAGLWEAFRDGTLNIAETIAPYGEQIGRALLSGTGAVGGQIAQLSLGILITFFLFRDGDRIAERVRVFVSRIAGARAESLLQKAHGTMVGVIYGIVGTAIVQGFLCTIGLVIAQVPGAILLGVAAAILSVIPFGVGIVLWSSAIWLFSQGEIVWALFLVIWGIPVGIAENVIKAGFISRNSSLPFVLIFLGLLGGAIAGGFTGIFWGPVVLTVSYTILLEWTQPQPDGGEDVPVDGAAANEPDVKDDAESVV